MKRAGVNKDKGRTVKQARAKKDSDRTGKLARVDADKVVAIDPPVPLERLQLIANHHNARVVILRKVAFTKSPLLALQRLHKYLDVATIADALDRQDTARSGTAWGRAESFFVEFKVVAASLEAYWREPHEAASGLPPKQWLIAERLPALWTEITGEPFTLGGKAKDGDRNLRSRSTNFVIACAAALGFKQSLQGVVRHYKDAQKHAKAQKDAQKQEKAQSDAENAQN